MKQELTQTIAQFKNLLIMTKRDNINKVISNLEDIGFFQAPASTKFHGSYDGGLVEHSLNVYTQARYLFEVVKRVRPDVASTIKEENLIISSLLHDICKSKLYYKIKKWRKDANNKWEEYETYEKSYKDLPIGHGEKSVVMLLNWGFKLTEDEILAIRWHMGGFDINEYQDSKLSFNAASEKPLTAIIVAADWLASRISEADPVEQKENLNGKVEEKSKGKCNTKV